MSVTSRSGSPSYPRSQSVTDGPGVGPNATCHHDGAPRSFARDASIAILGIRGTGKTSLGFLASVALGFRLIDMDKHFLATTGLARAAFAAAHGHDEYRKREVGLMRSLLHEYPTNSVIVCGPGSVEGTGQELLRHFAKSHPVIYVIRDTAEVTRHLRTNNCAAIQHLELLAGPIYRSLSNFEFYNLSELSQPPSTNLDMEDGQEEEYVGISLPSTLVLKHVEEDFLNMLDNIGCGTDRLRLRDARHSLSYLSPEFKPYTYALTVPISLVSSIAPSLRREGVIADAVELAMELPHLLKVSKRQEGGIDEHALLNYVTKQYYVLRRNIRLPVVLNLLSPSQQSSGHNSLEVSQLERSYFQLLQHLLRLAPEYVVVDLQHNLDRHKVLLGNKGSTRIIGHFYDANPQPDAWKLVARMHIVETAEGLGCDLVRICQPARDPNDNFAMQMFAEQFHQSPNFKMKLIAFNTESLGRRSVFTNSVLTPVTHKLIRESSEPPAPWVLTVQEAQNALYSSFILEKMHFFVFGSQVFRTASPEMHNAAFRFCSIPHEYFGIQTGTLQDLGKMVHDPCFGGASITMPFKKEVISIVDYLSPEAQAIGAVNTLLPLRDRKLRSVLSRNKRGAVVALFGDNTDWIGIHTCIRGNLSPINTVKSRTTGLVIGGGGMARAAIYAMIRLGIKHIFVYNRTLRNAEGLVTQFSQQKFAIQSLNLAYCSPPSSREGSILDDGDVEYVGPSTVHVIPTMEDAWPSSFDPPAVVISCIPALEKNGKLIDSSLPPSWLQSNTGGVAIELAYDPIDTPFLQQVRAINNRGWIAVNGLQVLPEQGIAQFELYTGVKAPQNVMRSVAAKRASKSRMGIYPSISAHSNQIP
ncbi:hypothetical protein PFICI_14926 [Pestalotiopsis fici W106-1]|uniref:Uncharacterized protein n=1 Tax=Pestalotiopsis fici (strain W106-1 / CGMCC3.15140) TaxID=1229662 RepID=W3WKI2_PESFW|nr:uncharacterized protein PFICI_14926 [Pestalotiopsis fici W106-1]ETS73321.1 hypothetical protein PFICI_14926 [Pestalotiopsis fici W106-1]